MLESKLTSVLIYIYLQFGQLSSSSSTSLAMVFVCTSRLQHALTSCILSLHIWRRRRATNYRFLSVIALISSAWIPRDSTPFGFPAACRIQCTYIHSITNTLAMLKFKVVWWKKIRTWPLFVICGTNKGKTTFDACHINRYDWNGL